MTDPKILDTLEASLGATIGLLTEEEAGRTGITVRRGSLRSLLADSRALRELVEGLPRCGGTWLSGSGGHVIFAHDCQRRATWSDDESGSVTWRFCDEHVPERMKHSSRAAWLSELPYAVVIRRLGV